MPPKSSLSPLRADRLGSKISTSVSSTTGLPFSVNVGFPSSEVLKPFKFGYQVMVSLWLLADAISCHPSPLKSAVVTEKTSFALLLLLSMMRGKKFPWPSFTCKVSVSDAVPADNKSVSPSLSISVAVTPNDLPMLSINISAKVPSLLFSNHAIVSS